jgi:Arc/MetJ-type ribon-helix-helix transcriptional regulator
MTIDLKPEQQRVIDLAVRSGAYQNPSEVLGQAFEIIREQLGLEDWMLGQREEVAAHSKAPTTPTGKRLARRFPHSETYLAGSLHTHIYRI